MSTAIFYGFFTGMLIFVTPLLLLIFLRIRGVKEFFHTIIGASVYLNFYVLVFNVLIFNLLGSKITIIQKMDDNPLVKALILTIFVGAICELGRYVGVRFGLDERKLRHSAVALGFGYGMASSVSLVGESIVHMAAISYFGSMSYEGGSELVISKLVEQGMNSQEATELYNTVMSITFTDTLNYSLQIACNIIVAVALSILMLGTVRKDTFFPKNPKICLLLCIFSHWITEGVPILIVEVFHLGIPVVCIYFVLIIVGALFFIYWSGCRFPGEVLFFGDVKYRAATVGKFGKRKSEPVKKHIAATANQRLSAIDSADKSESKE